MLHARCFYLAVTDAVVEAVIVPWRAHVGVAAARYVVGVLPIHGCEDPQPSSTVLPRI